MSHYKYFSEDVWEYNEVISKERQHSHIDLECDECHAPIYKCDEHYLEKFHKDNSCEIFEHRTCLSCMSIREHILGDFFYGHIWDSVDEMLYYTIDELDNGEEIIPWDKIALLENDAKLQIFNLIEKHWLVLDF